MNLTKPTDMMAPPLIVVILVIGVGLYLKTLKFCTISRCSKIQSPCCSCDREVLDPNSTIELATYNSNPNFPMINNRVPEV